MDTPPKKIPLPKLRKSISLKFNGYDHDGRPQWLIQDHARNKFFIIGWLDYELLQRWSIDDAEKLLESVNTETTLHADLEDLDNLAKFLRSNYLIQQSGYQIHKQANEQKLFKTDGIIHWLITYYLFFRIPLFHPDKFLEKTAFIGKWVFSRITAYVMLILGISAIYQVSVKWEDFAHTFPTLISLEGLILSFMVYAVCKLCHELGHAYMCKNYGISVPSFGIAFLVFWPVLYTDTTLSWSLNHKQRLRITMAGIWVETYIAIIAALIWANTTNITLQTVCYITIAVNFMASLLLNASPFMRFDGYYALADYLNIPNLQPRAFSLTRWKIRCWLFGWSDPPPEKFSKRLSRFLIIYSIITWIYRLTLYFGIAALVYHFTVKLLGIILFIVEVHYFILAPFVSEAKIWYMMKEKFSLNTRTKITIVLTTFLIILFFLPINTTIRLPATLSYHHAFLIAAGEGVLTEKLPSIGQKIKKNELVIKISSPTLIYELNKLQLSYYKTIYQLRRSNINPKYSYEKNVLESEVKKQESLYKKLKDMHNELFIYAPFAGVIIDTKAELNPGDNIKKGEWLGDIVDPSHPVIEAFVAQADLDRIRSGLKGRFFANNLSESSVPVKVDTIEVLNASDLNCRYSPEIQQEKDESINVETACYNASDLGGDIPNYIDDKGEYVSVGSIYRVSLTPTVPITLSSIERGSVFLDTSSASYAYKFFYYLKTLWIEESGF